MNILRAHRIAGVVGVLMFGTALGGGCQFKGAGVGAAEPTMAGYWWPQATAMRVYPSTRFVEAPGEGGGGGNRRAILEARIELRDEMGDAVKAAGIVGLELFAGAAGDEGFGRRLYRWDVTMQTLEDQQRHFDSVTRTYLFRLELDAPPQADDIMLRATFTRASDGRRLQADARIE